MLELAHMLPRLILASQSSARKELLQNLGIEVTSRPTHSDESHDLSDPNRVVLMLALRKLQAYRLSYPSYSLPVLCCDTLISFNGRLIGKPLNRKEAKSQLLAFSGNAQLVHSGWALWHESVTYSDTDQARVWFKNLDERAVEDYLDTLEWQGAAGSYRIQGAGKNLIDHVEGDEGTVIGLPVKQIFDTLAGIL